uniref:Uncharacterized protein n=1 Tax=Cyanothece sp. (strain PCC 7425 / ATCC 29141) TaxID=395961 RepID=B8HPY1_CYAP4
MQLLEILQTIQSTRTMTAEQENLLKTLIWSPDIDSKELDLLFELMQQLLNNEIASV